MHFDFEKYFVVRHYQLYRNLYDSIESIHLVCSCLNLHNLRGVSTLLSHAWSCLFCGPSHQMVRFQWENIISLVRRSTEKVLPMIRKIKRKNHSLLKDFRKNRLLVLKYGV